MTPSDFWLRDSESFVNFSNDGDYISELSRSLFKASSENDEGFCVRNVGGKTYWYPYEDPLGGMFQLIEIRRL